jgi:regulator of extracellular matrix RemA (YlzA/DUF370 family)
MIISLGYGHGISKEKILVVIAYGESPSTPVKRMEQELRNENKIIDITNGKRVKSAIMLTTGHMVLTAVDPVTLTTRINNSE